MTEPEKDIPTTSMEIQPHVPGAKGGTRTNDGETKTNDAPTAKPMLEADPNEFAYLDPPQAPDEIGRLSGHRVLRVLGRGGMGVVFEAEDPLLGRRVAIKVPSTHITGDSHRKRFIREARIAATLSNDHIAAIYQAGQHGSVPFLIMEMLRGEPLDSRLDREKTLPVGEALRVAREIAEGLQEAHGHDLVHRDIKPGNIWLEQREAHQGPRRAKILDFGLAREANPQEGITTVGNIVGTMGYMAPEQVYAGQIDGRTDLFALGCVLYEMLTGRLPFKGSNTVASLKAVVYEQPDSIAVVAPQLPAQVRRLVNDLLEKDPAKRPASAEVVVERIKQIERELTRADTGVHAPEVPVASSKRQSWGILFGIGALAVAIIIGGVVLAKKLRPPTEPDPKGAGGAANGGNVVDAPIKIGILHSLTGALASTEIPVADATVFAIKEINKAGGVHGRRIEWVLEDGRSTEEGFAAGAEKLIREDHVAAIFGCWTSSSRKRVEEACRKSDNLLVYPINYEGLEDSPYVMYVGGAPNQELVPAVGYAIGIGKHRFFLVGTDHVYSRSCSAIIRDQLKAKFKYTECVGEEYVPLHETASSRFVAIAEQIKKSGADVIFSTVDGHQANLTFFHALADAGVKAKESPVFSFSFFEEELRNLDERDSVGHYAVACYFESIKTAENQRFLKQFKATYPTGVVNDPMEAAYCGVHLWQQAVIKAGEELPAKVRVAMADQKFEAPEGLIAMDPANHHAIRSARIGQVVNNREFKIVFTSDPLMPEPFPPTRTREQWQEFLEKLYRDWGNRWEGPRR